MSCVLVTPTRSDDCSTPVAHPRRKQHDPQFHAEGMITKAALSAALISLRRRCGLTQSQLCRRSGWKAQFVSRLESGRGRLPDFTTLMRYGKACGTSIGLLFARSRNHELTIVTAVTLQAPDNTKPFESFAGHGVHVPLGGQGALEPMPIGVEDRDALGHLCGDE